ncbi:hypothetical protein [Aeromonas sp. sif0611]|uniref:hypothetical protein n=1 Tax=Aeromonas sp. sif0611 TaxID=2854787 RepID=UPI001C46A506|nr:hypothetical protein [Aeromonas sp. sif0611]MBV7469320.1 hypothetical protein [Aeromonas sp. sif0611]
MLKHIELAFEKTIERYSNILNSYYPAHNGTGFTERNLTNNFVSSLDRTLEGSTISWFEAPLSTTVKKHLDAVVFHPESKTSFLIEAKRISNPSQKINSIKNDIERMRSADHHATLELGLQGIKIENRYAIVLADIWLESKTKIEIYNNWPQSICESGTPSFIGEFDTLQTESAWKNNYKILGAAIKI